ncbi:hypothetical protein BV898_10262 [Hypsibius exemplaris]|uniref:Uncharacterized protein n=1 Tax=Hypsibius exemplaris TaxID=2072580 RepID=A0A1W0WJZ8_HYPEX|nr:hypothetical protein BV898_10262 [Hypsibius exemplaris]
MDIDRANFLIFTLLGIILECCNAIPGPIDLGQALSDRSQYPQIKGYFRIEANIIQMLNPRGTTRMYLPCDVIPGRCDPKISVAIDYETPNNDFGKDSVPYSRYVQVFDGSGLANVDINKIVSKDVCNHDTRKVNVRVRAVDKDWIRNDEIDHYSCFILTTDPPAEDEKSARWSEEKTCVGHNGSHKIIWKYRWFFIPESDCKEIAGSSGIIRRNIPFFGK